MTLPAKRLLKGQLPVPSEDGDVACDIPAGGAAVRVVSCQGRRPYQEDRFIAGSAPDLSAAAAAAFLADIFAAATTQTRDNEPGSTATAVFITRDLVLNAAWLGDSPLVVFLREGATGEVSAHKLTRDHHARVPEEKARIERDGGTVAANGRLGGILEMSRAFGDAGYTGLSREPEYVSRDLARDLAAGRDVYICLSSDGLYEDLAPENYVRRLHDIVKAGYETGMADVFCAFAYEQGSGDNMTALTFRLPPKLDEGVFLAIADGHGGHQTSQQVIEVFRDRLAARFAAGKAS